MEITQLPKEIEAYNSLSQYLEMAQHKGAFNLAQGREIADSLDVLGKYLTAQFDIPVNVQVVPQVVDFGGSPKSAPTMSYPVATAEQNANAPVVAFQPPTQAAQPTTDVVEMPVDVATVIEQPEQAATTDSQPATDVTIPVVDAPVATIDSNNVAILEPEPQENAAATEQTVIDTPTDTDSTTPQVVGFQG